MSMTDPIADMLTRIRNAQKARHDEVEIPLSKLKADVARVMKEYGYISDVAVDEASRSMTLALRYTAEGEPVIRGLRDPHGPRRPRPLDHQHLQGRHGGPSGAQAEPWRRNPLHHLVAPDGAILTKEHQPCLKSENSR